MEQIGKGVTYARGFRAAGVHAGIRKNKSKPDLALVLSDCVGNAAGIYTRNRVKGAPLTVTRRHLADGHARAMVCNSGNANTCNADGPKVARAMCKAVAGVAGVDEQDVIVASTGVIGQPLDIRPIRAAMPALVQALSVEGHADAARAIMTTDTVMKEAEVDFTLGGVPCRMGGMAKGSGMIHPNMATMLVFLTTDAAIAAPLLRRALLAAAQDTFHMISVDGDTSTNDMVCILANGKAGNPMLESEADPDYPAFFAALSQIMLQLSRALAKDGEGASKLLVCTVQGASSKKTARVLAKSVITSSLFKAAMFGADANWGRVLCALGYAGAPFLPNKTDVAFASSKGSVAVCCAGRGVPFSEERAKEILLEDEITVTVDLHMGTQTATAFGCDLTYEYVKINGDYRT